MRKPLVVKEYDTIVSNEALSSAQGYVYLDENHFDELNRFIEDYENKMDETDVLEFVKIGFRRDGRTITFKNYVGIIELPSGFQIEILPKISLAQDENNAETKKIFIKMLNCLREFEGKIFNTAALNTDKMNLYEIFIRMFVQQTRDLVKRGIKSDYINTEENLNVYKGKLNTNKNIIYNAAHKERFYMMFDEYSVNRPENKLIKSTLLKLLNITTSQDNSREIRQLLCSFEMVDESVNYDDDFARVSITRGMKEYDVLIKWAKIFLQNKSFTTFTGEKNGRALLFPMEQVFEAFVAKQIKRIFEREANTDLRVTSQDYGYYLFDSPRCFRLRPDIVVRNKADTVHPLIIMDTKWKRLTSHASMNYGISQADMYQMYAYSKKYQTPYIWLLYPLNDDVRDLKPISFEAIEEEGQQVNVRVFFVDLADYEESIRALYYQTMTQTI